MNAQQSPEYNRNKTGEIYMVFFANYHTNLAHLIFVVFGRLLCMGKELHFSICSQAADAPCMYLKQICVGSVHDNYEYTQGMMVSIKNFVYQFILFVSYIIIFVYQCTEFM